MSQSYFTGIQKVNTIGSVQKTWPCLVISPDEMNRPLKTAIVAPMTTKGHDYPSRVSVNFQGKNGQIVLDPHRTVDKGRLIKRLGKIDKRGSQIVLTVWSEMFAP